MDVFCKQGCLPELVGCVTINDRLLLDANERRLIGADMEPMLSGELSLLIYLGSRTGTWHTTQRLALSVYHRQDLAGRAIVWKYMSMLRRKLRLARPQLIEVCRRRGYRCREPVEVVKGFE